MLRVGTWSVKSGLLLDSNHVLYLNDGNNLHGKVIKTTSLPVSLQLYRFILPVLVEYRVHVIAITEGEFVAV